MRSRTHGLKTSVMKFMTFPTFFRAFFALRYVCPGKKCVFIGIGISQTSESKLAWMAASFTPLSSSITLLILRGAWNGQKKWGNCRKMDGDLNCFEGMSVSHVAEIVSNGWIRRAIRKECRKWVCSSLSWMRTISLVQLIHLRGVLKPASTVGELIRSFLFRNI